MRPYLHGAQGRSKELMNRLSSSRTVCRFLQVTGRAAARLRRIARGVMPVALGMALSGCALLPAGRSAEIAANEPTPTPIPTSVIPIKPTYTVKVGEIMRERTFSGRVAPVVEEALFFRVSGRVRSVYVLSLIHI